MEPSLTGLRTLFEFGENRVEDALTSSHIDLQSIENDLHDIIMNKYPGMIYAFQEIDIYANRLTHILLQVNSIKRSIYVLKDGSLKAELVCIKRRRCCANMIRVTTIIKILHEVNDIKIMIIFLMQELVTHVDGNGLDIFEAVLKELKRFLAIQDFCVRKTLDVVVLKNVMSGIRDCFHLIFEVFFQHILPNSFFDSEIEANRLTSLIKSFGEMATPLKVDIIDFNTRMKSTKQLIVTKMNTDLLLKINIDSFTSIFYSLNSFASLLSKLRLHWESTSLEPFLENTAMSTLLGNDSTKLFVLFQLVELSILYIAAENQLTVILDSFKFGPNGAGTSRKSLNFIVEQIFSVQLQMPMCIIEDQNLIVNEGAFEHLCRILLVSLRLKSVAFIKESLIQFVFVILLDFGEGMLTRLVYLFSNPGSEDGRKFQSFRQYVAGFMMLKSNLSSAYKFGEQAYFEEFFQGYKGQRDHIWSPSNAFDIFNAFNSLLSFSTEQQLITSLLSTFSNALRLNFHEVESIISELRNELTDWSLCLSQASELVLEYYVKIFLVDRLHSEALIDNYFLNDGFTSNSFEGEPTAERASTREANNFSLQIVEGFNLIVEECHDPDQRSKRILLELMLGQLKDSFPKQAKSNIGTSLNRKHEFLKQLMFIKDTLVSIYDLG